MSEVRALNRLNLSDPEKEKDLRMFLVTPIDSRQAVEVPNYPKKAHNIGIRTNDVPDETKRDWESRLQRIREYKPRNARPVSSFPSLKQRQISKYESNPYHCHPVEEIQDLRYLRMSGPVHKSSHLPKLRYVPTSLFSSPVRQKDPNF